MKWHELPDDERKGSRSRCLLMTDDTAGRSGVADRLSKLLGEHGSVAADDRWAPCGLIAPGEIQLGRTSLFLDVGQRRMLRTWWLKERPHQTTLPVWDLVSTATIRGRSGLLLVEAKAHRHELDGGGKRAGHPVNEERIRAACRDAADKLDALHPGRWILSTDSHYQLANRFAWSWKLAALGIPVALVYLGFIDAHEMRAPLASDDAWRACVAEYSKGRIPERAWGHVFDVDGVSFVPLMRSARVDLPVML